MHAPAGFITKRTKEQSREIDLLLELLLLMRAPEARFTHEEIAEFCGVSDTAILEIERRALRKLRKAAAARGLSIEDLASFLS